MKKILALILFVVANIVQAQGWDDLKNGWQYINVPSGGGGAVTCTGCIAGSIAKWSGTAFVVSGLTDSGGTVTTTGAATFAGGVAASKGISWAQVANPGSHVLQNVIFANGLFVAVDPDQDIVPTRISTSPNGQTWTARTTAIDESIFSVAYGAGLFVAAGSGSTQTSPDGITWSAGTDLSGTFNPLGGDKVIAFGNGIFVISASNSGDTATSTDGLAWTIRTGVFSPVFSSLAAIRFGAGLFVATGDGIRTSPDGVTWTTVSGTGSTIVGGHLGAGGGRFVAFSDGGTDAFLSADGLTWTASTLPSGASPRSIGYGAGVWVIGSGSNAGGATPILISFDDGATWSLQYVPDLFGNWTGIAYGNGVFAAVSGNNNPRNFVSGPALAAPAVVTDLVQLGNVTISSGFDPPSGTCDGRLLYLRTGSVASTTLYVCNANTWSAVTVP